MLRISGETGISLLEFLITLVFIAVIGVMAIPVYQNNQEMNQRNDAKAALNTVVNQMEQYYLKHKHYTDDMKSLGFKTDPMQSEKGFYKIDAKVIGKSYFIVKAVPVKGKDANKCGYLTVDSKGKRGSEKGTDCW